MSTLQMSSGDLVADRRASYAEMLFEAGEGAAAAELMREALGLVSSWVAGWFRLGEMLADSDHPVEAIDAFREVLRLDPADRLGAILKLRLLGVVDGIDATPPGFVEALFDQYAPEFDAALLERLEYRVPALLTDAIAGCGQQRFAHLFDLGCGTGLMGERLLNSVSFLEGVDISAKMLKRAETKQIYGRLSQADINFVEFPAGLDLVTAADVFMYVGALEGIFCKVAAALPAGGLFAFSVEHHEGPEDTLLRTSRRYAHSERYIRRTLASAGFEVPFLERSVIRMDRGEPIEGLIVVGKRAKLGMLEIAGQSGATVEPSTSRPIG